MVVEDVVVDAGDGGVEDGVVAVVVGVGGGVDGDAVVVVVVYSSYPKQKEI